MTRLVFYPRSEDNPFLDPIYISELKKDIPYLEQQRLLEGKWISIRGKSLYHSYSKQRNYRDYEYEVDPRYPIYCSWDFNIGHGKPLSMSVSQFIDDTLHIFAEVVIEGSNTEQSCDELADLGILEYRTDFFICGDATGRHRDTRSNVHDYDIIERFFGRYRRKDESRLNYKNITPISNPQIRERIKVVNAYCYNANKEVRLFVYKGAPTASEGLMLTKAKPGSKFQEDDTKRYQHITTTIGYLLVELKDRRERRGNRSTVF
jgi:hypothetical protein